MIDIGKIEDIYNKVVEHIRKEEASKGKASLAGISGKELPVSVNINGCISNVRGSSTKAAPDLSSLDTIKKHIERYPTKILFHAIGSTKELREYGVGGNASLHWAVLNKMYSLCDSFDLQKPVSSTITIIDEEDSVLIEGRLIESKVLKRQRNRVARERCLVESKCKCYVCGFDFEDVYGEIGKGFIEVHHKRPISTYDEEHEIPQSELVALCSNCHSMVHHGKTLLDVDVLKELYNQNKNTCAVANCTNRSTSNYAEDVCTKCVK